MCNTDDMWAIMCDICGACGESQEKVHKGYIKNWLPSKKKFVTVLWIFNSLLSQAFGQSLDSPPTLFTQQPRGGSTELKGNTKVLLCVASGQPAPVYRWLKDSTFITPNQTDTSLKIANIQESDAGVYQCMASNQNGAILSDKVEINVAYIKHFNSGSNTDVSVSQGHAAVVRVPFIDSYPAATVTWHDGANNFPVSSDSFRYHVTLANHLVILESRYFDDNDKPFKAKALNSFTAESSESDVFRLTVQDDGDRDSAIGPEIVIPPSHTTAVQGVDYHVTIECVANARPSQYISLNWYRLVGTERQQVEHDNIKYLISFYRRKLTIRNPVVVDSGTYECEAEYKNPSLDQNFTPVSAHSNLTVYVEPTFQSSPPSNLNADFGSTATIMCRAIGIPTPTVKWYRNGDLIEYSDDRFSLKDNTDLYITDLVPTDTGMYQCFVSNVAGEINSATWLRVFSSAPEIVSPPQNQSIISGDTARFPCEVTGAPKPEITWTKVVGGVEESVTGDSDPRIRVFDQELVITQSLKGDSAKYVCNATNNKGQDSKEAFLHVILRTRIITPPQDQEIIKGSTVELPCTVDHDPSIAPVWGWFHKDIEITPDQRRSITDNGGLKIKSIRNTDIGVYRCMVSSLGGSDTAQANIIVIELPYPPSVGSAMLNGDEKRAVDLSWMPGFNGNSIITKFVIYYRIVPSGVFLYEDEGWIVADNSIPASRTSYTLRSLLPARFYQFRVSAVNGVGEGPASAASTTTEIPQEAPSAAPQSVFGSPRSNSSIIVQWSPPPPDHWNGYLLGYNVRYKPAGYPDSTLSYETIENTGTLYELKGLIVFQEYEIAVASYNAKGVGVYSNYVRVRTKEGIPARPPTSVVALAVNSTAIKITWSPPDSQFINGINQGYKLAIHEFNLTSEPLRVTIQSDTSNILGTQVTHVRNLKKFTDYTITVLCFTAEGDGPKSSPVEVKTREDVPDMVGNLKFENVLDTSLEVMWTPPENSNGILIGFTLNYMKTGEPLSLISEELDENTLRYVITGLTATTGYTIEVFARTVIGKGPSAVASIKSGIPPEIPEPPTDVVVTDVSGRSVLVRFTPGFSGYTSISKWLIEAQISPHGRSTRSLRGRRQAEGSSGAEDGEEWFVLAEIVDPEANRLTVEGLRPYTRYRLRIIAVNIEGVSEPSGPSRWFETTQAAPDAAPSDVSIRVINETAFRITWTPLAPEKWNGEDRGYRLEAKMADEAFWDILHLIPDQHANSYILSALQEYIGYSVRVAAYNKIGKSPFSDVINDTTRESVPSAGPVNVLAEAVNSTSIQVTWEPVPRIEQNGLITGYKIKYMSAEAGLDSAFSEVPGADTHTTLLNGLKKFVEYQVQVLAFTRIGDGKLSQPTVTVKTLEDVPGPPSSVYFPEVTWTTTKVVWSPPTEPNGFILGYKVSYRQEQDPLTFAIVNDQLTAHRREYYVDRLQRDTFYVFSVQAKTSTGWGEAATLRVRTIVNRRVPDKPTAPIINTGLEGQVGDRHVVISWQPGNDGYGPIRNFTIQYQRSGPDDEWGTVADYVPHTETSFTVEGLKPNTAYSFRVAATNDVGTSDFSSASRIVTTLQAAPESAPVNLAVTPQSRTSVLVTWQPPPADTTNGDLKGYNLEYRELSGDTWRPETLYNPTVDMMVLTSLVLFKTYEFRIQAFNDIGESPWSSVIVVYNEIVPSLPPTDVVAMNMSSTEIQLSWLPPSVESQNGDLLGYKIYYQVGGASDSVSSMTVAASQTSTVIGGLQIFTQYNFTVLAFNRAGEGPNTTDYISAQTDEGVPGPTGSLMFAVTSLTTLNVSWAPPATPNGIITMYMVSYYQDTSVDGERRSVQVKIEEDRQYLFVSGLVSRVNYIFSVRATTRVGEGPETTGDITTGPRIGSPAEPSVPEVEAGDTALTLTWTNGYHGDSPIQGYIIQAREQAEEEWTTLFKKNTPEALVLVPLSNLDPNTAYEFRVIVVNSNSISEPSKPSAVYKTQVAAGDQQPFYRNWWFLVIVALVGLIFIIVIVSVLCITGRNSKEKYKARRYPAKEMTTPYNPNMHYFTYPADHINRMPTTHLQPSDLTASTILPDQHFVGTTEDGFATFETRRSQRRSQRGPPSSRRSEVSTLPPYSRTPPRPSPGSVNYSDPDDDQKYADSNSDLTEKPSEPSDSEHDGSQRSESDNEDYTDFGGAGGSGRPNSFVNSYVANGDVRHSWKRNAHKPNNHHQGPAHTPGNGAYDYSESEGQDSSQYAMSLNGGTIMMNNMAGSRAPLPGFSSFV